MIRSTYDHISLTTSEQICFLLSMNVEQNIQQSDIFDQKFVRPQELP